MGYDRVAAGTLAIQSHGIPFHSRSVSRFSHVLPGFALAFLIVAGPVSVHAQLNYTVHALEEVSLANVTYQTFAKDVTEEVDGVRCVVGFAQSNNVDNQPVLWAVESNGISTALLLDYPTEWFAAGVATAINNRGQIIGGGLLDSGSGQALGLYWPNAASAPVVLPGLTPEATSLVQQINDDGIVVGISSAETGNRAVAWRILPDDTVVGPLVLPTRPRSAAGNDAALAVGSAAGNITPIVGRSAGAAIVWRVRTIDDSLTLEGSLEVLDSTGEATGIDSAGAVCGNDRNRSIIWGPLSGRKRTKTQLNYNTSLFSSPGRPSAISDSGVVVGTASLKVNYPAPRAVIWTGTASPMRTLESMTDGNFPFLYIESALAINGAGDVVGYGWQGSEGGYQAFIAIPANDN
jgi:uncharacterized membrane protein